MEDADQLKAKRQRLKEVIRVESDTLKRALVVFVARSGLVAGEVMTHALADELLNELTVEALEHAARFDPSRQSYPWLLGIAANLVKRRQSENARLNRREPLVRDMPGSEASGLSDDELFDRLAPEAGEDPAHTVEQQERMHQLLSNLNEPDQQVIRLALLNDMDGKAIAATLKIQPGAARVRLHRALMRLRRAVEAEGVAL